MDGEELYKRLKSGEQDKKESTPEMKYVIDFSKLEQEINEELEEE